MNSDLEEIKSRLNIVDVLGEYIRLEKAGSNYRALCPFHNEKSPSFMVSEEKQFWKCFGCGLGGDIFSFVMEIEGLEFREALKQLAEKAGVTLQGYDPKKAEIKNRTLEILELATKFYEVQLWKGNGKIKILNYLRQRGLKDETIREFRLGYAPKGWRNILEFLTKRGFKVDEIEKTGLLVKKSENARTSDAQIQRGHPMSNYYDRFRERIMFPIGDYSGKVVGYSARVAPGGDESQAKYVNTPETEVYHKSHILYGLDKAKNEIKEKDFALLVEGNMDVIAASQTGIKNVVAVSGTALTPDQIKIIKRYTPKVKMFFDMDSAGQNATKKSMKLCFASDMNVEVVSIPEGKDAADLAKENPEELKKYVDSSKNAIEYLLDDSIEKYGKNDVGSKRKISELMVDMLSSVASAVEKSHWIKKVAEKLETTEAALTDTLKKVTLRNRVGNEKSFRGRSVSGGKEDAVFSTRPKIDILLDEILGIILAYPDVWREAIKEPKIRTFLPKDSLLNTVLAKGESVGHKREKIMGILEPAQRERAEELYFQKKFRMGLNNELEEIMAEKPGEEFRQILKDIEKEIKKKQLEKIAADLKSAEEKNDKITIDFLRGEFKRISDESQKIS
jgi:DNA primase